MEFGKVPHPANIDFSLPTDPLDNQSLLSGMEKSDGPIRIYIGATGWAMKEWVGLIYPAGTKQKEYLHHYARYFDTIELNSTYYRVPTPETIKRWYNSTSQDFRFCPKVPQYISHSRGLTPDGGWIVVEDFCETVEALADKLGVCFMQLPPHFDFRRLEILKSFLAKWRDGIYGSQQRRIPLSVELRHQSWFSRKEYSDILFELLKGYQTGAVITDVGGRRDLMHMRLSAPFVLVRFVCSGKKNIDMKRLEDWAERLKIWIGFGLQHAYFFIHTPDNTDAPAMAASFSFALKNTIGSGAHYADLNLSTLPGSQMSLF